MSTKKKSNTKSNTAKKVDAKAKTPTAKPKAAPAAKAKKAEAKTETLKIMTAVELYAVFDFGKAFCKIALVTGNRHTILV